MEKEIFKYAKKFLPIIGIILLIYLIYSLGVEDIKNAFLSIHPIYIIIALSLTIPRLLIRNYAWQIIQKEQKIEIGYWKLLKIFMIGYFYCSVTPGFVGHVMRVPYLKEHTYQPYGKLFVNTVIEVLVRTVALYTMITLGVLISIQLSIDISNLIFVWLIVVIITIIILLYFFEKERGEKTFLTLIKYFIPNRLKSDFQAFVGTFYTDLPRIKKLIIPFFLGIITWIIIFSQEYIIVIALGLKIPYIYFILLFPIANIIGFIPITVAGIGTRDAAAVFIFTSLFPVAGAEILVVSLLGFILTDIFTGFVGFLVSLTETKTKVKNFF